MKTTLSLMCLALILTSCNDLKGVLTVKKSMTLKAKKGAFGGTKNITIKPKSYKATISPSSKTKLKLKLEGVGGSGGKTSFPFSLPKGVTIPELNGKLTLHAKEIKQPYDIKIKVNSDVSYQDYDRNESCVAYYKTKRVCEWVPARNVCSNTPRGGNGRGRPGRGQGRQNRPTPGRSCHLKPGHQKCYNKQVPVYGQQIVDYTDTKTTTFMNIRFIDGATLAALFKHQRTGVKTSVRGSTTCR